MKISKKSKEKIKECYLTKGFHNDINKIFKQVCELQTQIEQIKELLNSALVKNKIVNFDEIFTDYLGGND